jgi:hypothetical protein
MRRVLMGELVCCRFTSKGCLRLNRRDTGDKPRYYLGKVSNYAFIGI